MINKYKFTNNTAGGVLAKTESDGNVTLTVSLNSGTLVPGQYVYPITFIFSDTDLYTAFTTNCTEAENGTYNLVFSSSDIEEEAKSKYMAPGNAWELRLTAQEMNDLVGAIHQAEEHGQIGDAFTLAEGTDFNTVKESGIYFITGVNSINAPIDNVDFFLNVTANGSEFVCQTAYCYNESNKIFYRQYSSSTNKWSSWVEILSSVSSTGKHIGEIFIHSGKDIPSGSLRLDGQSIVNVSSAFPDFKKWAIDDENAVLCTLDEYENELAQNEDQCGKFGWDAATDTLRLPKISSFVGAALTAETVSTAVKAGLPNITGTVTGAAARHPTTGKAFFSSSGAFTLSGTYEGPNATVMSNISSDINLDASRSSAVYGRSTTVTPAHVKFPYFIHVYNSVVPASEAQASEFAGLVDGLREDVPGLAAHAASPANKYINLTQSSFPYSAPADGIVRAVAMSTKSEDIFGLTSYVIAVNSSLSASAGNQFDVSIPVSKNEEVQLDLRTYKFVVAYFIYLNGSAPSA